ncbi:hypothetical protein MAR_035316 [Mya arenaria]|uniref:Uncharacterized protein n=1 Tax=Mya arenaria TaxID=6604 RepID=A0ABY7ELZ4_MYAAR|nr:hypothetical protein MAR_035316 [Mya arenaria]
MEKNLRHRLVKYYQKQLSSAPISPLLSDKDEKLERFYVPPMILEKHHRRLRDDQQQNDSPISSYRQIFCKDEGVTNTVILDGEAGSGKSSFSAMCTIKWASLFSVSNKDSGGKGLDQGVEEDKSFERLLTNANNLSDRKSSLVFQNVDCLTPEELLFVLKSGLIRETKSQSLIRISSSFSFIHKTVQEFLAAVHIANHAGEIQRVIGPYCEEFLYSSYKSRTGSDVPPVFIYVCGLNPKVAKDMSTVMSLSMLDHPDWNDEPDADKDANFSLQPVIYYGFREAKANNVQNIQLTLLAFDFRRSGLSGLIFSSSLSDVAAMKTLLLMNKSEVRCIRIWGPNNISNEELQEVFTCSADTLTTVLLLFIAGQYDLSACSHLKHLTITGRHTSNIMINTNSLVSLRLSMVSIKVESRILQSLEQRCETLMKFEIGFFSNIKLFCRTLPKLNHLQDLTIEYSTLGDYLLLLPPSVTSVILFEVTMSAWSMRELVENCSHTVTCRIDNCEMDPIEDFLDIKRKIPHCSTSHGVWDMSSDIGINHIFSNSFVRSNGIDYKYNRNCCFVFWINVSLKFSLKYRTLTIIRIIINLGKRNFHVGFFNCEYPIFFFYNISDSNFRNYRFVFWINIGLKSSLKNGSIIVDFEMKFYGGTELENVGNETCPETDEHIYSGDLCQDKTDKLALSLPYIIGITAGVGGALLLFAIVLLVILCCRRSNQEGKGHLSDFGPGPDYNDVPTEARRSLSEGPSSSSAFFHGREHRVVTDSIGNPTYLYQPDGKRKHSIEDSHVNYGYQDNESDVMSGAYTEIKPGSSLSNLNLPEKFEIERPKLKPAANNPYYF